MKFFEINEKVFEINDKFFEINDKFFGTNDEFFEINIELLEINVEFFENQNFVLFTDLKNILKKIWNLIHTFWMMYFYKIYKEKIKLNLSPQKQKSLSRPSESNSMRQ